MGGKINLFSFLSSIPFMLSDWENDLGIPEEGKERGW